MIKTIATTAVVTTVLLLSLAALALLKVGMKEEPLRLDEMRRKVG